MVLEVPSKYRWWGKYRLSTVGGPSTVISTVGGQVPSLDRRWDRIMTAPVPNVIVLKADLHLDSS